MHGCFGEQIHSSAEEVSAGAVAAATCVCSRRAAECPASNESEYETAGAGPQSYSPLNR